MFRKLRQTKCHNAIIGIKSLGAYRYNNAKSSQDPYFSYNDGYLQSNQLLGDNSFNARSIGEGCRLTVDVGFSNAQAYIYENYWIIFFSDGAYINDIYYDIFKSS